MREVEKPRPVTLRLWIMARVVAFLSQLLCKTLRLTIEREQECEELIIQHGGAIFVTWHGRTMIPIQHFRKKGYFTLVSLSRDGDFLAELFRSIGLGVIRGSTKRRGIAAAREVVAMLNKGGVLAFTPDGPRGPSGIVQPGVVFFAQRSGKPIIPAGIAANPRWLNGSWDHFMIPRPFATARWIYGEPIFVQEGDDLEAARLKVEEAIASLEAAAERKVGIQPKPDRQGVQV